MSDLTAVTQRGQLGKETTPGTSVAASNLLPRSFGFTKIKPMGDGILIRPQGNKIGTTSVPVGYRWTEWAFDGNSHIDFNEIVYPLCAALKSVAPVADGTNGKRWTFTLSKNAVDTKQSYTFEQGDSVHAQKCTYAHMTSLQLLMSKIAQSLAGNWRGQQLQDDISLTSSPTEIADHIISPQSFDVRIGSTWAAVTGTAQVETATAVTTTSGAGNVTVTVTAAGMTNSPKAVVVALASGDTASVWAGKVRTALAADTDVASFFTVGGSTTAIVLTARTAAANDGTLNIAIADTGTTGITPVVTSANTTAGVAPASVFGRPFSYEFSIDTIVDALPRMNSTEASFVSTPELAPNLMIKFKTDADDAGMGYLANWTAGSTTFIGISAVGDVIAGNATSQYSFTLVAACKIIKPYTPSETNGSVTADWELHIIHDPTFGQSLQLDVVNTQAAL